MKKIFAALILSLFMVGWAFAQCPNKEPAFNCGDIDTNWNISSPSTAYPSAYVIYKSDSTYYAKNGVTGFIDYSGTNPKTIINNALSNLPNTTVQETDQVVDTSPDDTKTTFEFFLHAIDAGTLTLKFTSVNDSTEYTILDTGNAIGNTDCNQGGTGTALITSCTINYVTGKTTIVFVNPDEPENTTDITATYTHGRIWHERVVLKGDFDFSAIGGAILIPSYSWLDMQARIFDITITNSDTTNGNTDIKVTNGFIDNTGHIAYNGMLFTETNNLIVQGVKVKGSQAGCVELKQSSSNFEITGCDISECGDDGLSIIDGTNSGTITNNNIHNLFGDHANSCGVELEDATYSITVASNYIHDNLEAISGGRGICALLDPGGTTAPHDITISSNVIVNVPDAGILINSQKAGNPTKNITISNNTVFNEVPVSGAEGIKFVGTASTSGVDGFTVAGNLVSGADDGISISYSRNGTVSGNTSTENIGAGMILFESTHIVATGNELMNNSIGGGTVQAMIVQFGSETDAYITISDNLFGDNVSGTTQRGLRLINADEVYVTGNDFIGVASDDGREIHISGNTGGNIWIKDNMNELWVWDDNPLSKGSIVWNDKIQINNANDGNVITATVGAGMEIGQRKSFYMSAGDVDDTLQLTITPWDDSDATDATLNYCLFNNAGEYLTIEWVGATWVTVNKTCTWTDVD